jgi:hypothetical protein
MERRAFRIQHMCTVDVWKEKGKDRAPDSRMRVVTMDRRGLIAEASGTNGQLDLHPQDHRTGPSYLGVRAFKYTVALSPELSSLSLKLQRDKLKQYQKKASSRSVTYPQVCQADYSTHRFNMSWIVNKRLRGSRWQQGTELAL